MSGGVDIERLLTVGLTKKELAETLVDVYKQLEDLKKERKWHLTADRQPTEDDADDAGFVWTLLIDNWIYRPMAWHWVVKHPDRYPIWCKTPGSAPNDMRHKI